jgi:hypothetical protein
MIRAALKRAWHTLADPRLLLIALGALSFAALDDVMHGYWITPTICLAVIALRGPTAWKALAKAKKEGSAE